VSSLQRYSSFLSFWTLAVMLLSGSSPGAKRPKTLQIYAIDVEGGQATLIVSPSGQSLLVDTGWPGFNGRDAARIVAAGKAAGIQQIDYVVITHYHRDHVGGTPQLADRMPIKVFMDHGPNQEDSEVTREDYAAYQKLLNTSNHVVLRPGDGVPLKDATVRVLTAAGERLPDPLPAAGTANPYCSSEPETPVDNSENARSVGLLVTYGKFRFLDLGDLTKRKELEMACPNNMLGTIDLFLVSHHGSDQSNTKALVYALHPTAAIIDNGAHKGGSAAVWDIVHASPGLQDLWQLHYAVDAGPAHNSPEELIANPEENCQGKYIRVTAQSNGTFTVLNSQNGFHKTYHK